jgi:hypothetical protein
MPKETSMRYEICCLGMFDGILSLIVLKYVNVNVKSLSSTYLKDNIIILF